MTKVNYQCLLIDWSRQKGQEPEGLPFCSLNDQEAAVLEEPFSEEEIVGALKDLNGEKALGPDGFMSAFWQFSWDFVKGGGKVLEVFKDSSMKLAGL